VDPEFKTRLRQRLDAARVARQYLPPNPLPRYDEVFFEGLQALEEADMNPDTNRFEPLTTDASGSGNSDFDQLAGQLIMARTRLLRPDGTEVPKHWAVFQVGELVVLKDYTFKVAYIGENTILLEPVGPVVIEQQQPSSG
jgi:hypothetical protein